ncbi:MULTISPECIES: S-layer homology domain-containing protein [unclassified Paenibacillus]|uniref:S-layer homology domain-containing protein n=1 Tax=unclassified Paenibacillus TaxID=185978 RepID=UPI003624C292
MNYLLRSIGVRIALCIMLLLTMITPIFGIQTLSAESADKQLFYDSFEYGDGVAVPTASPSLWSQDGSGGSLVKTTTSGKHTGAYGIKLDATDSLSLHLSTVGYQNIQMSYWYKSSVTAGGVKVEYSANGGSTWFALDPINGAQGSFKQRTYTITAATYTSMDNLPDVRVRFSVDSAVPLAGNVYIDDVEVRGTAIPSTPEEPSTPQPEGPEIEFFSDNFDDPDNYGSDGNVTIPSPWVQEGAGGSAAKTSVSASAPSLPNFVKIDSTDALALPLNTTGYGNIKLSYYTRASSYVSGSIIVEWSGNGGSSWTTLEEFKLPQGTAEQKNSESNKLKAWILGAGANNNTNLKIRFRVGNPMQANMYIDSVSIKGQAIPGIPPAVTPVPDSPTTDPVPFPVPNGVTLYEDVAIGTAGSRPLYTSIAVPSTPPAAPMPVVVYIHGGGWNHGDRKQALANICGYVTKRGYIGVSLDYRLTPEAPFPAQIQDVKLAIRYLRANAAQYHIDPDRIGVWGSSAGGHLASLLGTSGDLMTTDRVVLDTGNTVQVPDLEGSGGWQEYSDKVQAVADWFGPADFTTTFANNYSSVTALMGGKKAFTVPDQARLAMPGTYASPDDPPFWIRHGDADSTIPYTDSVTFANQLTAAGVKVVDFKVVPGQGHGFTGAASETANAEAWAFMDQHVKNRTVTEHILYKNGHTPGNPTDPNNPNPGAPNVAAVLNPSAFTLEANGTKELTVSLAPSDTIAKTVTWTTYDSSVAAVSSSGLTSALVTAVGPGKTKIRANITTSVNQQVYAESEITVMPQQPSGPGAVVETDIGSPLPTDDALIDSSKADTNFNSATGTSAGLFSVSSGNTNKKFVYFKYDLSGLSDPAYNYIFQVAGKKGSSNTNVEMSLYGIENTDWNETDLTWGNAPVNNLAAAAFVGKFTVSADKGSNPELYSVDVSDYVRSHLSQGKITFVVGDAANTGTSINIYSKEANGTSNPKPRLVVKEIIDISNDKTPPSWLSGSKLAVSNLGTDFINLYWPAAVDDTKVTQYQVYQNNTLLAVVKGSTSYNAAGLNPGAAYTFKVEAVDAAGNISTTPLTISRTTLSEPLTPLPVIGVTASSSDGNIEINTIDSNSYTRWSASGDGQWIMFDLDEIKSIGYVGIGFYKGDMRSTNFEIETSVDGITWTQRFSGSSSGRTTAMQAFDIPDTDARYVRVTGHGNSDGSTFTSLTDVHIYAPFANGDTPVAVIPYIVPGPPPGAVPFTQPGMTNADGTNHPVHMPHVTSGRVINVLDYGADPSDNRTDDRPAIQAAINAAVEGDEVYLPNGTYNLNTAPDGIANLLLKTGVNLRGESESGTVLKTALNKVKNSTLLKAANQHELVISNLTLTSTWEGAYTTDHKVNNPASGGPDSMIVIANYGDYPSYNITIDHVTVEKFTRMGIRIDNSHDVVVKNSSFRNATDVGPGGSGYGVAIQGMAKVDRLGYDNDTRWNLVENSSFEGPYLRHGALIQFVAHNNTVRNNHFNKTKLDAIDLHGELEYLNDIYGNLVTDITTGGAVGLGNTGGTAPSNHSKSGPKNYIHDNIIRNSREGIVVTMGTPDTIIENNLIENTTNVEDAAGINVLNGPGTIIRNNVIRNNTAPNYWAILLEHDKGDEKANYIGEGDPLNVQILNNTITGNTNGIQLQAGTGIVLRGNKLDNSGTNYLKAPGVTAVEEEEPPIEEASSNADLSDLKLSTGTLAPVFNPGTTAYTVTVPNTVSSIAVTPTAADGKASLTVNGTTSVSGAAYNGLSLNVGDNPIQVIVTAANKAVKTYTVVVKRLEPPIEEASSNADLSDLTLSAGTLAPAFNSGTTAYTATVPNTVSSIAVTPTAADGKASLTVNGTASVSGAAYNGLSLNVGDNPIQVIVTAANKAAKTFTVVVKRLGSSGSSNRNSGGTSSSSSEPSTGNAADAGVTGVTGITEIKNIDGKLASFTIVNEEQIGKALQNTSNGLLAISVDSREAEQVNVMLDSKALQKIIDAQSIQTVSISTKQGTYLLPSQQINIIQWVSQLNVKREDMKLEIVISRNDSAEQRAEASGLKVLSAVDFTIHVTASDGRTLNIDSFTQYVARSIKSEHPVNEGTLAAVRVSTDGSGNVGYSPVPFTVKGNEVTLYSRTNSTYMLMDNHLTFNDIEKHWAKADIEKMANKRIVQGVTFEEFHPNESVTRAEFAALITRVLGLEHVKLSGEVSFKDVPDDAWYRSSVAAAVQSGIVSGYEDGIFRPDQTISRQEMALMIFRTIQFAGSKEQQTVNKQTLFADQGKIAGWAQEAVSRLTGMKLMEGVSTDRFAPSDAATRAQSAVMLSRMLSVLSFTK